MDGNPMFIFAIFAVITAFVIAAASIVRFMDQSNADDHSQDSYFEQHWGD